MNNANIEILCPSDDALRNNECFCDWRVQIKGCPSEENFLQDLYITNTVMCFLVFLMITALLIWRTSVKGQRLIARDTYNEMGILRPRPLECFLLLNMFHICARLLYSVCLLSDYLPNNLLKELFHDVTFTISLASLALYLIGLIYTIPRSHTMPRRLNSYTRPYNSSEDIKEVWVPLPIMVDSFGFFVLLGPIVSLNALAIISGFYMDKGNSKIANFWITIHYETKETSRENPTKLKSLKQGLKKLRLVLAILLCVLLFFATSSLLFGLFRTFLLTSPFISRALAACWILIVPMMNVIIVTILAIETNNKEPIHILRQSQLLDDDYPIQIPVRPSKFHQNSESINSNSDTISPIALTTIKLKRTNDDNSDLNYISPSHSQTHTHSRAESWKQNNNTSEDAYASLDVIVPEPSFSPKEQFFSPKQ
ncbi:10005_t:CDS:2 [Diversispora eburnea]|uniref:10005_t:CDS:1 n=1 Tax=Diversispora eburnea TaxID=1213867 RepID=A0A9N9B6T1_9GLOM|nr:10005_t:CDS:2 [Diversispora eburnea]